MKGKKKVQIVVEFFSPTSPLPSPLFFVCHSNDELSMRRSPSCKLSDLTCSDAFEPCRLLMHSNKSFFFSFIGVYYTQRALRALKGSSPNNFTSSAESEIKKEERKKQIRNAHSHSPLTKSLLSFRRQNSIGSFKVIPPTNFLKC